MGRMHARSVFQSSYGQLVGIVDPDRSGQDLAAVWHIPYYHDLAQVPEHAYDAVIIAAPTPYHKFYVLAAASRKKSVFCEKPLALTVEDSRAMVRACRKAGVTLTVGLVLRFFPAYRMLYEQIQAQTIGTISIMRTYRGGQAPQGWDHWYRDAGQSGGTLSDLVVHDFDFLRWTLGPVQRVYSQRTQQAGQEVSFTTLIFEDQVMAQVVGVWAAGPFHMSVEAVGQRGLLQFDSRQTASWRVSGPPSTASGTGVSIPDVDETENPFQLEIDDFFEALIFHRPPRVSPEDAIEATKISQMAHQSIQSRQSLTVEHKGKDGD